MKRFASLALAMCALMATTASAAPKPPQFVTQRGVRQDIPSLCGGLKAGPHSVCGVVEDGQALGPHGSGMAIVNIPDSLAFPDALYSVLVTSSAAPTQPPSTCVYTGERVSPTVFAVRFTGCTFSPVSFGYQVTSVTEIPVR